MKNGNLKYLAEKADKKTLRRDKKKSPKMKVSGAGVKKLQKIILEKDN